MNHQNMFQSMMLCHEVCEFIHQRYKVMVVAGNVVFLFYEVESHGFRFSFNQVGKGCNLFQFICDIRGMMLEIILTFFERFTSFSLQLQFAVPCLQTNLQRQIELTKFWQVNAQHNSRIYKVSVEANKNNKWEMSPEDIPEIEEVSITSNTFLEHLNMTKDTTDYMWHTTQ